MSYHRTAEVYVYSKIQSSEKFQQQKGINELLDLAQILPKLDGHQLVAGVCSLYGLLASTVDENDPLLMDGWLMYFDCDCDQLPIFEDFREKCSPEYLAESEPYIEAMANQARPIVKELSERIASRFQHKDLGLLAPESPQILINRTPPAVAQEL